MGQTEHYVFPEDTAQEHIESLIAESEMLRRRTEQIAKEIRQMLREKK